jgi:hypothetical protein
MGSPLAMESVCHVSSPVKLAVVRSQNVLGVTKLALMPTFMAAFAIKLVPTKQRQMRRIRFVSDVQMGVKSVSTMILTTA